MLAGSLAVVAALWAPAEGPAESVEATDQPEKRKREFSLGLLATRGVDQGALVSAMAMRVPQLDIRTTWTTGDAADAVGTIFIDIHLARQRAGADGQQLVLVDIVAGDGRAFRRQLRASPDDARIIASFVSNLLLSIEEEAVEADQQGVEIPETSAQLDVARVIDKLDADRPEPAPADEPPETPPPVATPVAVPTWLPWQVGPRIGGQFNLAAGPPTFADTLAGAGGHVGVDLWRETGLLLDFDLRFLSERKPDASLLRVRGTLGIGYAWRKGAFSLPTSLAYTVEGYRVDDSGSRVAALDLEAPPLLNGLRLRTSPSARISMARGPLRALRVGVRGEIAGSFGLDDGPRVLGIRAGQAETSGDELFRLGGLELAIGIEFGADFGIRRRNSTP